MPSTRLIEPGYHREHVYLGPADRRQPAQRHLVGRADRATLVTEAGAVAPMSWSRSPTRGRARHGGQFAAFAAVSLCQTRHVVDPTSIRGSRHGRMGAHQPHEAGARLLLVPHAGTDRSEPMESRPRDKAGRSMPPPRPAIVSRASIAPCRLSFSRRRQAVVCRDSAACAGPWLK